MITLLSDYNRLKLQSNFQKYIFLELYYLDMNKCVISVCVCAYMRKWWVCDSSRVWMSFSRALLLISLKPAPLSSSRDSLQLYSVPEEQRTCHCSAQDVFQSTRLDQVGPRNQVIHFLFLRDRQNLKKLVKISCIKCFCGFCGVHHEKQHKC